MSLFRTIRFQWLRIKRMQGSVHSLALGFALGAAIGITPTLPLHNLFILGLTVPLRANPVAGLVAGNLVSNPLTLVPQYYAAWKIGDFLFPGRLSWQRIQSILAQIKEKGIVDSFDILPQMGFDTVLVMLSGGFILALPTGFGVFFLTRWFFMRIRLKRQKKQLLNNPPV